MLASIDLSFDSFWLCAAQCTSLISAFYVVGAPLRLHDPLMWNFAIDKTSNPVGSPLQSIAS